MTSPSLQPDDIDKVALSVLNLAQELWTLKERHLLLEHILETQGLTVSSLIDTYDPEGALAETLDKERQRFVKRVVQSLKPISDESLSDY